MFNSKHNYVLRRTIIAVMAISMILIALPAMTYASGLDYNYNVLTLDSTATGVSSITVSGGTVTSEAVPVRTGTTDHYTYTYNIVLSDTAPVSGGSDLSIVATFVKDSSYTNCVVSTVQPKGLTNGLKKRYVQNNASLTYTATIAAGTSTGTVTAYVYPNLTNSTVQNYDTYVFNYTCAGTHNPWTLSNGALARLGDPAYPLTPPEQYMAIGDAVSSVHDVTYNYNNNGYYPDMVALYVETGATVQSDSTSITVTSGGASGGYTGYTVDLSGLSGTATGNVKVTKGGVDSYLKFHAPHEQNATGSGTAPTSVVSYLPLGQFATGSGWGSSAGKFVGKTSPEATGVSLGALGGYIEFYFANGITNDNINSYGVDFTVYGNAFNNNPEAGSVQVSEDGKVWYELAGSLYYEDGFTTSGVTSPKLYAGTQRNCSVLYEKNGSGINATINPGNNPLLIANPFTSTIAWFPESNEGYPMGLDQTNAISEAGGIQNYKTYHNATGSTISVNYDSVNGSLGFGGITAIEDSDSNGAYGYGYCDVTPNGTMSAYGTAVNPYEIYTSNKTGGDGFDLEWAVNNSGEPVSVKNKTFKYVRVYSSVLHIQPPFGETSAEVTGIFVTANPEGKTSVGQTDSPSTIVIKDANNNLFLNLKTLSPTKVAGADDTTTNTYTLDLSSYSISNGFKIQASSDNTKIFINNDSDGTYTYNGQTFVRIVAQQGFKAPYILVLRIK